MDIAIYKYRYRYSILGIPSYQAAWIILGIISSLQEAGPRLATTCQGKAGEFDRKIKAWLLKR